MRSDTNTRLAGEGQQREPGTPPAPLRFGFANDLNVLHLEDHEFQPLCQQTKTWRRSRTSLVCQKWNAETIRLEQANRWLRSRRGCDPRPIQIESIRHDIRQIEPGRSIALVDVAAKYSSRFESVTTWVDRPMVRRDCGRQ